MTTTTNTQEQLILELKVAIQTLFNTKVQCREMLQLVDNLSAHIHTVQRKVQHARQQDYWASNLVHVSEHLSAMEESVKQIESGKLKINKSVQKSIVTLITHSKEFADLIGDVYQKIIVSIAPIEADVQREIALEQQHRPCQLPRPEGRSL